MSEPDKAVCWICRTNPATTREHLIKHSDLKALLGKNRAGKWYWSDQNRVNKEVQSLNATILKSPIKICEHCNGARTQPPDLAWAQMSQWLRTNKLSKGQVIRPNRIFKYDTRRQMLNVHLYFLKLFGGMIGEGVKKEAEGAEKIPIDIAPFADAIMHGRAHKEVFLQFGIGDGTIGRSNLNCQIREDRKYVIAHWIHRLGPVAVNVLFLQQGEDWRNLDTAWHPKRGKRKFQIVGTRVENAGESNIEADGVSS